MDSLTAIDGDAAVQEFVDRTPGLYPAVEAALVATSAALKGLPVPQARFAFPDMFRAHLNAQLESSGFMDVAFEAGQRNSVLLRLSDAVIVRVLKATGRQGHPAPVKSKLRQAELAQQGTLDLSTIGDVPARVVLTLTWQVTAAGVELVLCLPKGGRLRRFDSTVHWQKTVPYPALPDVDAQDDDKDEEDLGGYTRRQDETGEGDGDQPA